MPEGDGPRKPRLKWLDPNHDKFKRSQKHETRLAKELGGQRTRRSGGMRWSKWDSKTEGGDIDLPDFYAEHKRTDKASMSIKKAWLKGIEDGAASHMKDPILIVTFEEKARNDEDWVMIPIEVFKRLLANSTE